MQYLPVWLRRPELVAARQGGVAVIIVIYLMYLMGLYRKVLWRSWDEVCLAWGHLADDVRGLWSSRK